jgi:integrase
MDAYRDLALPKCVDEFRSRPSPRAMAVTYELPAADLRDRTIEAGRGLRAENPRLYIAFVLCYDLALRAGEAAAARWDWIRADSTGKYLDIIARVDYRPKGRPRSVPISAEVMEHLSESLALSDGVHLLPGVTHTDREDLVKRELATWMRGLGWEETQYPKAGHELRKLMGSRWYTERGAEVAQTWLGHKDISTTCRYYATLTRQPAPLSMEVFNGHPKTVGTIAS